MPYISHAYLKCLRCQAKGQTMFLLGDLNIKFCKENNSLQCILNDYGLTNALHGPMCFTNPDETKQNDVILNNCPQRLASTLNSNIGIGDNHCQIQAATKMYVPKSEKRIIHYRTYKHFNESHFLDESQHTPFQVAKIVDDPNDKFWFHSKLWESVIDLDSPRKKHVIKAKQLSFMNGQPRKAIHFCEVVVSS